MKPSGCRMYFLVRYLSMFDHCNPYGLLVDSGDYVYHHEKELVTLCPSFYMTAVN